LWRNGLKKLKRRIEQIKKKRPGYEEILDFYRKVRQAQDEAKASVTIGPIQLKKEWKKLLVGEGFPLIQKEDFPIDLEASVRLFQSLCQIGVEANPHMAEQVRKIQKAMENQKLNLQKLFEKKTTEKKVETVVNELGLDKKVFSFLIQNSTYPSIEIAVKQLSRELESETWTKGYCPICGSLPLMSVLKEDAGKRYLLCSYCRYLWRTDRLFCPFCNNNDHETLHYLFSEEEEAYRIDLCDKCHQYIKTVDYRNLAESDPVLEDLSTLHLDVLASQKGYQRPFPNPWA
jgi:FdhE protein